MNKKEMGLAVRAIAQYASDCSGNGDYLEMDKAFKIAVNMASTYELKEEDWIVNVYLPGIFFDLFRSLSY